MKTLKRMHVWQWIALLVAASMLLMACGNVTNNTQTPQEPGEPPVVEEPLGEEPVEEPPAEEPEVEEPTEEPEAEEPTMEEPETEEPPAEEPTEAMDVAAPLNTDVSGNVEFWHFWGSPVRRAAIRRAVSICEQKLPNIQIEEVFKPYGDIWTANIAAVSAGSGMPDIIVEDRPQLPQRAADGIATNLQPYVDQDNLDPGQFWDFTWEEASYEGDVYGIPFETDVRVLFWNKQAFEEVGLDPEDPPETWDEMWEYAEALDIQNEDGSYERIGAFPLWNAGPDFWAYTNGWEAVQDGRPNVTDQAYVETIEWIQEWVERYGGWQQIQNYQAQFSAPPNDLFMSGAVGMIVDIGGYHSILSFYRPQYTSPDGETQNMEWGISHIPYNEELADWSGGFALSIPRGAEYEEAAWEVIKCLAGPEVQISWARDTYAIPTNRNAAYDEVMMSDPYWAAIIENMEYSRGTTHVSGYPNWTEQVNTRLEQIWTGQAEAEATLQEAQDAINAQIGE